jgi:hypothetical protein
MIVISHHDHHHYGLSYWSVAVTRIENVPFIKNTDFQSAVPLEGWHEASFRLRTKICIIPHGTEFSSPGLWFVHPCLIMWKIGFEPGPLKQGDHDRQLVPVTCKRRPFRHIESCPTGTLRLPWLRFLSCFFSSVVRQMPGCNTHRRGTARSLTWYGGYICVPKFHRDLIFFNFQHDQSGFESQKALQPKFVPT